MLKREGEGEVEVHYLLIILGSLSNNLFWTRDTTGKVLKRLSDNSHHLGRSADGVTTLTRKRNHPFKSPDTLFFIVCFQATGSPDIPSGRVKKENEAR